MKATISIPLVVLILTLILGCESDDNNTGASTNHAPIIQNVTATPMTARQHDSWGPLLQCVAIDEDGDSLKYYWESSVGDCEGAEELKPSVR